MTRDHATVNYGMTNDPDYRALPVAAQHLYLTLWVAPGMSWCGVRDWRPGRISGISSDLTPAGVKDAADCLRARRFLVIDDDTEEVLVRSWVRFDGLMKQPRLAVSFVTAYAAVASEVLRGVIVHEAKKLRVLEPDLKCWADKRVQEVLLHPSTSARDLPPVSDPFGGALGVGLGQTLPNVSGSVSVPPTPSPTPSPTPNSRTAGASAGAERDGDDAEFALWYAEYPRKKAKGQALKAYRVARKKAPAADILIGLRKQVADLKVRPADKIPYPATWLNGECWNDEPDQHEGPTAARALMAVPEDHERPPDGMSPDEWAEWDHDRRQRAANHRARLMRERGLA